MRYAVDMASPLDSACLRDSHFERIRAGTVTNMAQSYSQVMLLTAHLLSVHSTHWSELSPALLRCHPTSSSCRAGSAALMQMPAVLKPCPACVPCRKRRGVAGRPRSKIELLMESEKRAAAEKAARQQAGSMHKRSALDLPHDLACC